MQKKDNIKKTKKSAQKKQIKSKSPKTTKKTNIIRKNDSKKILTPEKKLSEITMPKIKMFKRWDSDIKVDDPGLKRYINTNPRMLPRSAGALRKRFYKSKMHIIERIVTHLIVSGHKGKTHRITSGTSAGKYTKILKHVEKAMKIIEKNLNKNPLEVVIQAIVNAAPREEIISYKLGGIVARESAIISPQRRIDKTLRYMAQSVKNASSRKKKKLYQALAEEIIEAYKNSDKSGAIKEKHRLEREAAGAR